MLWETNDYSALRLYSTTELSSYRFTTLAQNRGYRNCLTVKGYYQSNWTDYYLGDGMFDPVSSVDSEDQGEENKSIPGKFALAQNYPNPFNPVTTIRYQIPFANSVDLSIYNILGKKVDTLVNGKLNAGFREVQWDASKFASGVYIYRIETGKGFVHSRKLILLK